MHVVPRNDFFLKLDRVNVIIPIPKAKARRCCRLPFLEGHRKLYMWINPVLYERLFNWLPVPCHLETEPSPD